MGNIDLERLTRRACGGERAAIATGLNILEDSRPHVQAQAGVLLTLLESLDEHCNSHLIGMTGPPGAGKSSLIAALITVWRERGQTVGVLAVDPTSPVSGGALLGDRLRMQVNTDDDGVFIRSLSDRGQFGGLSPQVWPLSLLMLKCFDIVVVETVGVGQREVDIASSSDTTCFVAQPGSGDSIQFLKAGILEVPHLLVVNKSDMGAVASRTLAELSGAISGEHPDGNWQTEVLAASATQGHGVTAVADALQRHHQAVVSGGLLRQRRQGYQAHWLLRRIEEQFGRAGVAQLGGDAVLLKEFENTPGNPLDQYHACVERLQARSPGN